MEKKGPITRLLGKKNQSIEKYEIKKDAKTKRSVDCSPENGNKKRVILCNITNTNSKSSTKIDKVIKVSSSSVSSIVEEDNQLNSQDGPSAKEPQDKCPNLSVICETSVKTENFDDNADEEDLFSYKQIPSDVIDFDKQNMKDPYSESQYAPYIFTYYRSREKRFIIDKYLSRQSDITGSMRSILIDWMVEVQESFELNHETLYLAVKLVDFYLMKQKVRRNSLQLIGATAMLIACKYDERLPPLVDDFLYICDDGYSRAELLNMEIQILKCIDFDLGIPLSYRFLRRYARCAQISMENLTLARFILETSLMDYELIDVSDSKLAAATLLLALKLKRLGDWTPTLKHYSGYGAEELMDLVKHLNKNISTPVNKDLLTIRTKYSHKIFFEVAKIPPLKNLD